ncbi:nitrogen fixation protein NifB [Paenibacillus durus]|uniref:FeMo cofactor biosynthesis protein NifB n=2 Tax=Paenibacillus durus TaxID=44251 RepID=A0A089HQ58_PAEDU|nr:nitrogen fixation protein NifB [Paenibacillus durus]
MDMEPALARHPCYNEEAHHHFARMHAAVAPRCNIQCHYCNPKFDCVNESRPGVVSKIITPQEAFDKVSQIAGSLPNLSVVGIAGPGDPLANPEATFDTFRLIAKAYPDIHLCLSTNGLMLPDYIDEICELGIRHVTVTLNAIDANIGSQIYAFVRYNGTLYKGKEAAALLMKRQLEGIKGLTERGVLCKVNSVIIPGVNDSHLSEVTREVKKLGAFSHNIMPLILSPGSRFQKDGFRAPTLEEITKVQHESSRIMPVMRHCRQCRADAVGLLGSDLSQNPEMLPPQKEYSAEQREKLQQDILSRMKQAGADAAAEWSEDEWSNAVRIAVATRGSNVINQHFGHAKEFLVYDVLESDIRLVGVRKVQAYCNGTADCSSGEEPSSPLAETLEMLKDCKMLLCSGIGKGPSERLRQAGIIPLIKKGNIDEQLLENARYMGYFKKA